MNVHDAERMAGLLEQSGYDRAESDVDADLVVINTCSVRERAEEKLYTRLGELKEMGRELGRDPIVAVTGCVAQQEGEKLIKRSAGVVDVVVGTQQMKMLPMLTTQALALSERGSAVRRPTRVDRALIAIRIRTRSRHSRSAWCGAAIRCAPTSPSSRAATTSARFAWCRTPAATS